MAIRIIQKVQAVDVPAVKQMFFDQGATNVSDTADGTDEFTITAFFLDVENHADFTQRTAPLLLRE